MPLSVTHYKERKNGTHITVVFWEAWDNGLPKQDIRDFNKLYRELIVQHLYHLSNKKSRIIEILNASLQLTSYELAFTCRLKNQPKFYTFKTPVSEAIMKKLALTLPPLPTTSTITKPSEESSKTEIKPLLPEKKPLKFAEKPDSELPPFLFLGKNHQGIEYMVDPALLDELIEKAPKSNDILLLSGAPSLHR